MNELEDEIAGFACRFAARAAFTAISVERERCATLIERRPGDIPDRQEIARRIRSGTVISADGTVEEPTNDRP